MLTRGISQLIGKGYGSKPNQKQYNILHISPNFRADPDDEIPVPVVYPWWDGSNQKFLEQFLISEEC